MNVFNRVKSKIIRIRNTIIIKEQKKKLRTKDFTVISQNCIGGVFYHDMGMRFLSPTIDVFFSGDDFVKFVLNLDYYLEKEIIVTWGDRYPIGYLEDIVINFQHYDSCDIAKEKWEIRKKRINKDSIVVLCTDMEGFSEHTYREWTKIKYPKVLFSAICYADSSVVYYPEYKKTGKVADLIPKRQFYRRGVLINTINHI